MTLLINNMTLVHDKLLANLHLEICHQDSFQPTEKNVIETITTNSQRTRSERKWLCSIRCEVEDREGGETHPSSWKPRTSISGGRAHIWWYRGKYFSCFERQRERERERGQVQRCRHVAATSNRPARGDTGLDFFSDKIISYQLIQSCDDTTLNNVRKSSSILLKLIKIKKLTRRLWYQIVTWNHCDIKEFN